MSVLKASSVVVVLASSLVVGCAHKPSAATATTAAAAVAAPDISGAAQAAKTPADHLALANQYEQLAKEADAKAAQQQKMLDQYKEHPYVYGKEIYELEDNSTALITHYQKIAAANRKLAALHQRMAGASK